MFERIWYSVGFSTCKSMRSSSVIYELNPFHSACLVKTGDGLLLSKLNVCLKGMICWQSCGAQTCNVQFSLLHSSELVRLSLIFIFSSDAEKINFF